MPNSIDPEAQKKRRRDAIQSAAVCAGLLILSGLVLLWLRWACRMEGFWSAVLVLAALLELGMTIPVWRLLKTRLKEIDGGEEDAAAQY